MDELLQAALRSAFGLRIVVNDPQLFRAEFDAIKASDPLFLNLFLRASPTNPNEIWVLNERAKQT